MILELCKGVHCVDLGESFQTHIYLQNFASIQPRTSPVKFDGSEYCAQVLVLIWPVLGMDSFGQLKELTPWLPVCFLFAAMLVTVTSPGPLAAALRGIGQT